MSDQFLNHKVELDAHPITLSTKTNENPSARKNSLELYHPNTVNNLVNNSTTVNNQNSSSTNISFESCNGITLGNVVNVGIQQWAPHMLSTIVENPIELEESLVYKKTPTIKAMMESSQTLSDKYLDIFCAKLGHKYQAICVLLKIDELDVQQALEDHKLYGTSEVLYQILRKYFEVNRQYSTIGWLTKFLWKNNFRQNVWAVKELWKLRKEIDEDVS